MQRSITVVRDGRVDLAAAAGAGLGRARRRPRPRRRPRSRTVKQHDVAGAGGSTIVGVAAAVLFVLAALSPAALLGHLTVFALAIVIGYYVIGHVHHALHTPLMSVTNAISGIIVVGALLQIGQGDARRSPALAFVAILLATINVFGGFAVTRRMLAMFSRS